MRFPQTDTVNISRFLGNLKTVGGEGNWRTHSICDDSAVFSLLCRGYVLNII